MNFPHASTTDLSRRSWSPATTGPPGPSAANYVAVDGPPDQVWLPWMVRFAASGPPWQAGKTVAAATNRPIQLHCILTDEFEVTIKIFRNNAMHSVCCNSESSLAAKTTFFFLLIRES